MVNEDQNTVVTAVIALLKGINVDGETMEQIINEVGMYDQMKSQLCDDGLDTLRAMPEVVMDQIASDIVADLDNEGLDLIDDQTYGINGNEIYLEDITFDTWRIKAVIRDVLRSHFTPME